MDYKQIRFLNSKEIKKIKEQIIKQFGFFPEYRIAMSNEKADAGVKNDAGHGDKQEYAFRQEYAFLLNEKEKLFIVNKDVEQVNLRNLKLDRLGLYFADMKNEQIRLSKEGAQFLALKAGEQGKRQELKNAVELNKEEVHDYFAGRELEKDLGKENRLVLLEFEGDVFCCTQYKEGKILNFMPKMYQREVIV